MKNWEKKKLGDVCSFVRGPFGGSLKKNIFKLDGYAVYEQQHAIYDQFDDIRYFIDEKKFNEMKRFELNSGDLIMSCSGTMGKIAIVPENIKKGIINQALLKLSPSKKISTVFLKLLMQSESFQKSLKEYSGGAAIQNVASVAILKQIEIPIPPLPEQQRIVAILDEAFAAIAQAKANAEQNLKNAKELFESYLQGVFDNKGDGWEEKTLGEVCKVERGSSPRPIDKYFTDNPDGVNWIKIGDTKAVDKYIYTTRQKITKEGALQSRFVNVDDFILSNSMSFGKPYIMKTQGYIHDGWFVLRLPKNIDTEFFWYLLASPYTMNQFISLAAGAIVKNISGDLVKKTILPIPPLKAQQAIVQKLDALSAETKKLEAIYQQKINDLEELKKSVLQKAFSGELRSPKEPVPKLIREAKYTSDAATPIAKKKTITSPERAQ
jgi:type I restriction enzyme S subunit